MADEHRLIVKGAEFRAGAAHPDHFPPPIGAEVAFAGRSNVGKSSLLNSLLNRRNLLRTSGTPGCTRQINFFGVTLGDAELTLVDLPGYGYAKRSKSERSAWGALIDSYLLERTSLTGVVLLIDVRRGLEADDASLLELLDEPARVSRRAVRTLVVATKLDKLAPSKQKLALSALAATTRTKVLGYSAKEHLGREAMLRELLRLGQLTS